MSGDIDTLLAIAEIAGVFVGFAALVSVVVIVGALIPVAFNRYGLSESTVWRTSSGILFVLNWIQILYVGRVTRGDRSAHSQRRGLSAAVWSLEPVYQLSLLLCIAGVWSPLAPAFYLTALVVALAQAVSFSPIWSPTWSRRVGHERHAARRGAAADRAPQRTGLRLAVIDPW
jgi:hypothetical protein